MGSWATEVIQDPLLGTPGFLRGVGQDSEPGGVQDTIGKLSRSAFPFQVVDHLFEVFLNLLPRDLVRGPVEDRDDVNLVASLERYRDAVRGKPVELHASVPLALFAG
jgi:hypothetical protein